MLFRRLAALVAVASLLLIAAPSTPMTHTAAPGDPVVLFVVAHPDDETLAASVAIAEHSAAALDVHLLWLTDGEGSGAITHINGSTTSTWWGVLHDPAAEGYAPLTPADLAAARIREGTNAVRALTSGLGPVTIHRASLPDGGVTQAAAEAAILAVADQVAPGQPVRLKTHSHIVDDHADHRAAGDAARALKTADPVRFGDLRHYILPPYWTDPRLSQVTEAWDLPGAGIAPRVLNAIRCYGAWAPPETYAIGEHSVPAMFATLRSTPKSMYHP